MWISSAESHLGLLDSVVRSAERLSESELCCLGFRRKVTALCLFSNIYHRTVQPMHECLQHSVVVRNTRASAFVGESALMIARCRTDEFSRSLLPDAVHLQNLLPLGVLSGGTLYSFKSAMNLCLQRALLDFFSLSLFPYLLAVL